MGLIGFAARQTRVVGHLRIVATPPGEAPEEIRAAWVGLALPLRKNYSKPVALPTVGVLSQKQTEPAVGYAVLAAEALPLLTRHNPEAAAWWQKSAPHTRAPGYLLIFPIEVCETEAA